MVKSSTPKKTATKAASKSSTKKPAAKAATPKVVELAAEKPVEATPAKKQAADAPADDALNEVSQVINKRALLARVAERCDMRPNKIRDMYEAVLAELGEALSKEEVLNLPPFGKISVNRKIENDNADIIICKIRRKKEQPTD